MADDTVAVRVPLDGDRVTVLRFRGDVFRRLVAEARAEGCELRDYLARRVLASGIGDDSTRGPGQELARAATLVN